MRSGTPAPGRTTLRDPAGSPRDRGSNRPRSGRFGHRLHTLLRDEQLCGQGSTDWRTGPTLGPNYRVVPKPAMSPRMLFMIWFQMPLTSSSPTAMSIAPPMFMTSR